MAPPTPKKGVSLFFLFLFLLLLSPSSPQPTTTNNFQGRFQEERRRERGEERIRVEKERQVLRLRGEIEKMRAELAQKEEEIKEWEATEIGKSRKGWGWGGGEREREEEGNGERMVKGGGRPKAFIHIGTHKSGSSTIQEVIKMVGRIAVQQGYNPQPTFHIFTEIKKLLLSDDPFTSTTLGKQISEGKTNWIISEEHFDQLTPNLIEKLKDLFQNYDVKIVVYARNPYDLMHSYWLQTTCNSQRYAKHRTFPEFFGNETEKILLGEGEGGLEFWRMMNDYIRVFGKENIIIVDFDGVLQRGLSLPGVFLKEIVGLKGLDNMNFTSVHKNIRASSSLEYNLWASIKKLRAPPCYNSGFPKGEIARLISEGLTKPCDESEFDRWEKLIDDHFDENLKKSGLEVMYPRTKKEKRTPYPCLVLVNDTVPVNYYISGKRG